jgi:hypothetical protein
MALNIDQSVAGDHHPRVADGQTRDLFGDRMAITDGPLFDNARTFPQSINMTLVTAEKTAHASIHLRGQPIGQKRALAIPAPESLPTITGIRKGN